MTSDLLLRSDNGIPVGFGLSLRVPSEAVGGSFSVHQGVLQPGDGVPVHGHETADQLLYVVDGDVRVSVGDRELDATAGDFVVKPAGMPHGFTNPAKRAATVLELTVSDQFERYTVAAAEVRDSGEFPALQAAHGIRFE